MTLHWSYTFVIVFISAYIKLPQLPTVDITMWTELGTDTLTAVETVRSKNKKENKTKFLAVHVNNVKIRYMSHFYAWKYQLNIF